MACQRTQRGFAASAPAERAGFGMLSAIAATIAVARAVAFAHERRRRFPVLRSVMRRTYHAPGGQQLRVHHFLPGLVLLSSAGAAAVLTRADGNEFALSLPLGTGIGLALDEFGLLLDLDNAYWGTQRIVALQACVAAIGAAALTGRFWRAGLTADR